MCSLIRQAEDGFRRSRSAPEPPGAGAGCSDGGSVAFAVGDALRDSLVRPGRVVVGR